MSGDFKTGFLKMTFSVVGVVILFSIFPTIITALGTLLAVTNASTFIAYSTIIGIAPTVLILGLSLGAGLLYRSGYKTISTGDASGLIRMVTGLLEIILFVTLFATIMSSANTLLNASNTTYIAFTVVMRIIPTVLFLMGIFAGAATSYGGYKAYRSRRRR